MTRAANYSIGIDIGGTKMAIGLVQADGHIMASSSLPTESTRGQDNAACRIRAQITKLLSSQGLASTDVQGIGVGCPGPLDLGSGVVLNPYTLPGWENESLVDTFQKVLELPVRLENDADAALLGECWMGAGREMDPVVMLTFGTGVGGAVKCGGKIYRGVAGEHPEIGLMPIFPDLPTDYSGVGGSLESLTSGSGIAHQGKSHGFQDAASVFAAAELQHPQASKIVQCAVRSAGIAGWTVAHTFAPECIILGGGLMDHHFDAFSHSIQSHLARATLIKSHSIHVVKARLGNQSGMVGAASLWF